LSVYSVGFSVPGCLKRRNCGALEGGGGGGGAYTMAVLQVTPGATYNVVAGVAGTRMNDGLSNGAAGGDSQFANGSGVLLFAGGGQGGSQTALSGLPPGGAGGAADPSAPVSHAGLPGGGNGTPIVSPTPASGGAAANYN